jgi:hypothetical protein
MQKWLIALGLLLLLLGLLWPSIGALGLAGFPATSSSGAAMFASIFLL